MKFSLGRVTALDKLVKELENGLRKLDFLNNFQSFEVIATFGPNEEIQITNRLQDIPKYYIIGRRDSPGDIVDGDQPWTQEAVYLKNTSANTITATIIITR